MPRSWFRPLIVWPLLVSTAAFGQYTAKRIAFSDPGPYTQQDLEAAAGMHGGQSFTTADLSAAAQRLSDTACFDLIEATLDGPPKAVTVLFKIKPAPRSQMLRAGFGNFVWLTPDALTAAIHAQVPLFHGYLPEAGNQTDAVANALRQELQNRNVAAEVYYATFERSAGQPDRIVEFTAVKRPVVIAAVNLTGISAEMQAPMQKQAALLTGRGYNEGLEGLTSAEALMLPYANAGYIEASISGFARTVSEAADRTQVTLSGKVEEGAVYRVSSITWAGSAILATADFDSLLKLHPEDVASRKALSESLEHVDEVYRNQGYMDVVTDAKPALDTATHHVAYAVTVAPGEKYHLRAVHALNLSADAQRGFDRGWTMKPGDVYSPGYAATFLKRNTALQSLNGYSASFKAVADPQTHLVDLTITFVRGPGAR